jgi:hypothetical protein
MVAVKVKGVLSERTLKALRIGDRPMTSTECVTRLAERTVAYAEAARELGMPYGAGFMSVDSHNRLIDRLDREYPGWRGYSVSETEGSLNNG